MEQLSRHGYPDVYVPFIATGQRIEVSAEEVVAAMAPINLHNGVREVTVGGDSFNSYRFYTRPIIDPDNPNRRPFPGKGGIQGGPNVSESGSEEKTVLMGSKNWLFQVAALIGMYDFFAGAKGAVEADPRVVGADVYEQVMRAHALEHNYGPWTPEGVGAPDEDTSRALMDRATEARLLAGHEDAWASFTGTSEEFLGQPDLRDPATGRGANIMIADMFRREAVTNPELGRVMERAGMIGGVILEGYGAAGRSFAQTLKQENLGLYLTAVIERDWSIVGQDIDPVRLSNLVDSGQLKDGNSTLPPDTDWEHVTREDAWRSKAVMAVPAAKRGTITPDVVNSWNGVEYLWEIANNPTTLEGAAAVQAQGVARIDSPVGSAGGVTASSFEWAYALHQMGEKASTVGWTPNYHQAWRAGLENVFGSLHAEAMRRKEQDEPYATIGDVANELIVRRAVTNLRNWGQAGLAVVT